jgi:hypothetical protein
MGTRAVLQDTFPVKLIQHWAQVCQKLTDLAEEVPVDSFDHRGRRRACVLSLKFSGT